MLVYMPESGEPEAVAPLTDRFFGYFADAHVDLGRYMHLDLRLSF